MSRLRNVLPVAVVVAFALVGTSATVHAEPPAANPPQRAIVVLRTPAPGARAAAPETANTIADTVNASGGRVTRTYHAFPVVAVEASPTALAALANVPGVAQVVPDTPMAIADDESTPLVGASATQAAGYSGFGRSIAILDTGVDKAHPFLTGKVVDEACYSTSPTCPNGTDTQEGSGAGVPCTFAPTDCRHGTHVAGIAAGGPAPGVTFTGVAPAAKLIAVQVFTKFVDPVCSTLGKSSPCALTLNSDMLAGLQHVYDVAAKYHVASVNMSIGGILHNKPCDTNVLKPAIDALRSIGVATVIAAGNDSFTSGLAEPGCISTAVSVGATTKADTVASYSNSSTWMSLWAPGSSINSSIPGGGYAFFNGTSMATPHVAGAFALARQAYPNESVTQLLARFQSNGPQITDARNGVTKRRLDIVNALRVIQVVPTTNTTTTEGDETLVPVTLSHVSFLTVSASWTTMSGTATDGTDFEHASGTVVFPPGSTSATIHIPGKQDQSAEGPEYGLVSLTKGVNAAIGGFYGVGVFNITDDD